MTSMIFLKSANDHLTEDQYTRLKEQIAAVWPAGVQRPILLEGISEVIEIKDVHVNIQTKSDTVNTSKLNLVQTSDEMPEQYDAFIGDTQVGYLRVRHGHFSVSCPDVGGTKVLSTDINGYGNFLDDERESMLNVAKIAIMQWVKNSALDIVEEDNKDLVDQVTNIILKTKFPDGWSLNGNLSEDNYVKIRKLASMVIEHIEKSK